MTAPDSPTTFARIAANRLAGLLYITVALPAGGAAVVLATRVLLSLNYQFTLRRLFVDWSLAFVMVGVGIVGLLAAVAGLRWLAFALWPGWLGLIADDEGLELRLGPFGQRRLAAGGLTALYRSEREPDDAALSTEDFIPPDEEHAHFLPIIEHADLAQPVNRLMDRYLEGDEGQRRTMLGPWIGRLRVAKGLPELPAGDGD